MWLPLLPPIRRDRCPMLLLASTSSTQGPATLTTTGAAYRNGSPVRTSFPATPSNAPVFAEDLTDLVIGADLRSVGARIEHVLEGEPFRVLDLSIVVERRAEQSGLGQPRRPPESRGAIEHAMTRQRFAA